MTGAHSPAIPWSSALAWCPLCSTCCSSSNTTCSTHTKSTQFAHRKRPGKASLFCRSWTPTTTCPPMRPQVRPQGLYICTANSRTMRQSPWCFREEEGWWKITQNFQNVEIRKYQIFPFLDSQGFLPHFPLSILLLFKPVPFISVLHTGLTMKKHRCD